jgi:hypothetical protein
VVHAHNDLKKKNLFLIISLIVIGIACNPSHDKQPEGKDELIPVTKASQTNLFPTLSAHRIKEEIPSIKKTGDVSQLIRSENKLYQKVREIFDFSIKPNNGGLAKERDKAQIAYRKFIKTYGTDTILTSQFRNQYAKSLLLDYQILESDLYADLEYYTNELIESHLGNYDLILKCLSKLEGNIDRQRFAKLIQSTHQQMDESVSNERLLKVAIADMIKQKQSEAIERQNLARSTGEAYKPGKKLMLSLLKHNQQLDRSKLLEHYLTVIRKFERSLTS